MQVRFRLEAAVDVEAARAWYEAQQSGLGDDFVGALEKDEARVVTVVKIGHRRDVYR